MATLSVRRKVVHGAILAAVAIGLSFPAFAKPPQGNPPGNNGNNGNQGTHGNVDCAKDNGKASPKKPNDNGRACGQKNNPPFN